MTEVTPSDRPTSRQMGGGDRARDRRRKNYQACDWHVIPETDIIQLEQVSSLCGGVQQGILTHHALHSVISQEIYKRASGWLQQIKSFLPAESRTNKHVGLRTYCILRIPDSKIRYHIWDTHSWMVKTGVSWHQLTSLRVHIGQMNN